MSERLLELAGEAGAEPVEDLRGEHAFAIDGAAAHGFLARLKDEGFTFLAVLTAVDNYLDEPRFGVVYVVRSMEQNVDVRVHASVGGENPEIATVSDLWPAADWMEREVYDMFGIRFAGHENLERILMWEGFEGWPLRKDYPLLGNTPGTPGYLGKGGKR